MGTAFEAGQAVAGGRITWETAIYLLDQWKASDENAELFGKAGRVVFAFIKLAECGLQNYIPVWVDGERTAKVVNPETVYVNPEGEYFVYTGYCIDPWTGEPIQDPQSPEANWLTPARLVIPEDISKTPGPRP